MLLEGQRCSHYRLGRLLKQGGMGQVYQAEDMSLQRQVAIKVIHTDFAHTADQSAVQEAARLFSREALAIAQLDNIHILPLYDYGDEYIDNTRVLYMVMPLRRAGSFVDWLDEHIGGSKLPLAGVERVVRQAADALQHAHDRHIIHKDVKSSNFLVRERVDHLSQLNLQLADFGVAKVMRLTSESQIIRGTPTYMAPEQWNGYPVPATDQYALAVMAYELLTGRYPFDGQMQQQLWHQHMHVRPAPPSTLNSTITGEIDEVILRALAKKPQNRFPSIATFAHAFRRAVLNSGNIQQTLSISPLDAQRGANRLVTLPDGRKVSVPVPAGTYQGQIIRMEGYGYSTTYDGPKGTLILTVTIMAAVEETVLSSVDHAALTVPISPLHNGTIYSVPPTQPAIRRAPKTSNNRLKIFLPFFMIAFVSIGGLCTITLNHMHANTLNTKYEVATLTTNNATATKTTALSNMSATKTAVAASTATAQAQATTTIIQNNPYPSYLPGHGQLALYDPLKDDSKGYQWLPTGQLTDSGCAFNQGGLDVSVEGNASKDVFFHPCIANIPTFSDFAYEVHMKVLVGDCGGVTLRGSVELFYYFIACQNGRYRFVMYKGDHTIPVMLRDASSQSIMNLNQDTLIAVWVKGTTINLYVNGQQIDSIQVPTNGAGKVGVLVRSQHPNVQTEAVFSEARVWNLSAS